MPAKTIRGVLQENQLGRFMIAPRVEMRTLVRSGQGFSMDAASV